MAKPRNLAVDFTVYVFLRLLGTLLRTLSFRLANRFAENVAWIVMKIAPRRVAVARENLRQAFPDQYSEGELDLLVQNVFRHFCLIVVEILHVDRVIRPRNYRDYLKFGSAEEEKALMTTLLGDRPVLMLTGHFGNWEVSGFLLGQLGFPSYAIARTLDNRFLDAWFRRWRESRGQKIVAKKGEFHLIQEALDRKGVLGTLVDQDAGARGLFVNFFNRPASTHKAVALLAIEHEAIMLVTGTARIGKGMQYQVYIEDVIDPRDFSHQPDAIRSITVRFTEALERMIRRHPEQYFWVHRRWKHQPTTRKKQAA
ncbi:MAG: lysophospholipid acyltransferase family protein [Planctomycetes bacterium]|nr:lysophospholipid acyltransferase family protein [Planctomycetota bacterium]